MSSKDTSLFRHDAPTSQSSSGASILERLAKWPIGEATRASEADAWRRTVRGRSRRGEPKRILFIHGQLPGETGSGVYFQKMAAAARDRHVWHVLSAGYEPLGSAHLPGLPPSRISTCFFTPPGAVPEANAVASPISGMSVVMPYPVLSFRDRTQAQLEDYVRVFAERVRQQIENLQPDLVHVNHLWFLSGFVRLAAPWIPLAASAHGTACKLLLDAPRFREWIIPCVVSVDHVCAISPASVKECVEVFGIPEERISIEGYGFDPALFSYREVSRDAVLRRLGVRFTDPVDHLVVFVGKFVSWKCIDALLEAVAILRRRELLVGALIVGEGSQESRRQLERQVDSLGLAGAVSLPGKQPRALLPDIYRSGDVFVLSSHNEPWGLVLMEALACGVPAVCANSGGPPSYIPSEARDANLAVLIDPMQTDEGGEPVPADQFAYAVRLADGIEEVVRRSANEAERASLAESMRFLSWDRLVDRLALIHDQLGRAAFGRYNNG